MLRPARFSSSLFSLSALTLALHGAMVCAAETPLDASAAPEEFQDAQAVHQSRPGNRTAQPFAFAAGRSYAAAGPTFGRDNLVVADFNDDRWPDAAIADSFTNSVSIFLGLPSGTFAGELGNSILLDFAPIRSAAGDFDGDGKVDLAVVGNERAIGLMVLLRGNGDGTFRASNPISLPGFPDDLAVRNVNRDRRDDLAVSLLDPTTFVAHAGVQLFLGKAMAGLSAGSRIPSVAGGALAWSDSNGDGNPDLGAASGTVSIDILRQLSIFLGNGNGTFRPGGGFPLPESPDNLGCGDFNGDRKPDLAVTLGNAIEGGATALVFYNRGGSSFSRGRFLFAGERADGLVVADFNRDGSDDLALENVGQSPVIHDTILVFLGSQQGDLRKSSKLRSGFRPGALAAADLDRDGRTDLIAWELFGQALATWLGNGRGNFAQADECTIGPRPSGVAAADIDGNGSDEIIAIFRGAANDPDDPGGVAIFSPRSRGVDRSQIVRAGVEPTAIVVGDLDGDHRL